MIIYSQTIGMALCGHFLIKATCLTCLLLLEKERMWKFNLRLKVVNFINPLWVKRNGLYTSILDWKQWTSLFIQVREEEEEGMEITHACIPNWKMGASSTHECPWKEHASHLIESMGCHMLTTSLLIEKGRGVVHVPCRQRKFYLIASGKWSGLCCPSIFLDMADTIFRNSHSEMSTYMCRLQSSYKKQSVGHQVCQAREESP